MAFEPKLGRKRSEGVIDSGKMEGSMDWKAR